MRNTTICTIELTQGKVAIIDSTDMDMISQYKWHFNSTGYACRNYRKTDGKRSTISMHRQIIGEASGYEVDHINGNKLDNRRENLRIVTRRQNSMNLLKYSNRSNRTYKSRFKGVAFDSRAIKKPWKAYITVHKKMIHLGVFATEEDAAAAYNRAAVIQYGEFAKLNEIGGKVS